MKAMALQLFYGLLLWLRRPRVRLLVVAVLLAGTLFLHSQLLASMTSTDNDWDASIAPSLRRSSSTSLGSGAVNNGEGLVGVTEIRSTRTTDATKQQYPTIRTFIASSSRRRTTLEAFDNNNNNATTTSLSNNNNNNNKPIMAILVATRSVPTWNTVDDTPLQQHLLPSIASSITRSELRRWRVVLYIATDHDDQFWKKQHLTQLRIPPWLIVKVGTFPRRPHHIPFNEIAAVAYHDGASYFCRINDDSAFVTSGWITLGTDVLQNHYNPPNVGVVGPVCQDGNPYILTHDMVHRTHLDIFGIDAYYPTVFRNWYLDNWMTHIYSAFVLGPHFERTTHLKAWDIKHHLSAPRYTPDENDADFLPVTYEQGRKQIRTYLEKHYPSHDVVSQQVASSVPRPPDMQMAPEQAAEVLSVLKNKNDDDATRNLLVWGLGPDSLFWAQQSQPTTGRVVFLDDKSRSWDLQKWYERTINQHPFLKVYQIEYNTNDQGSLVRRYMGHPETWHELQLSSSLPDIVQNTHWDVILIDKNAGHAGQRYQSIYMTKKLVDEQQQMMMKSSNNGTTNGKSSTTTTNVTKTHVFVHGYEREIDREFSQQVFGGMPPVGVTKSEAGVSNNNATTELAHFELLRDGASSSQEQQQRQLRHHHHHHHSTAPVKFDIVVLAMNRAESLKRLLESVEAADYGNDTVRLIIKVDHAADNAAAIDLAQNFTFSHGPKFVQVATSHQGLRAAWLNAWTPPISSSSSSSSDSSTRAIILEDDLEVSPVWYQWIKRAWAAYGTNDKAKLAGISLNRQSLIPDKNANASNREIVNDHKPFLYKLVGSQGFSPHPVIWERFLKFVDSLGNDLDSFQAEVPGLVTSDWYKTLPKQSMWTQLFIYFCNKHDLYVLYVNLPDRKTLVAHWREKGEHFARTEGRDFELATSVALDFPNELVKYGWSGEKVGGILIPQLVSAGTEYGGWTYDASQLTPDSIVYSIGLGEDTSWEEEIMKRHQLHVWGFDPTPKSVRYVESRAQLQDEHFHFTPEGLSTTNGTMVFTMPKNPDHVSMRQGSHSDMGEKVEVAVNTLENWMKSNGHTHLDILKMDIEGSEYDVIEDWIARDFFPFDQLLAEWHFRYLEDRSRHDNVMNGLREKGWLLAHSQNDGQETMFLRVSSINGTENDITVSVESSKTIDDDAKGRLLRAARNIADQHGVVIIQLLNEGYLSFAKSWICNVRSFKGVVEKTLFIATDQESYDGLTTFDQTLNVVHVPYPAPKLLAYGQYAYYDFMLFRTKLLCFLLENQVSLWLVESDACWLQDPTSTVLSTQGDIVTMSDGMPPEKILQGGFQLLRSTPLTIHVWKKLLNMFKGAMERAKAGSEMGDSGSEQLMMNELIQQEPSLSVGWLAVEHFVPGLFYENATYAKTITQPKVILNNWVIGNNVKVDRAKKRGHWFLTEDGKCDEQVSIKLALHTES